MTINDPKNGATDVKAPSTTGILTAVAGIAVIAARHSRLNTPKGRGNKYVSRQPSNPGRRKGKTQDPGGVQAPGRREVCQRVLHHQRGWRAGVDLPDGGMAAPRGEVSAPLQLQSDEEKVFGPHELLRPIGGDGQPGPRASAGDAARFGAVEGRSGGAGEPDPPGSAEHRGVPQGVGREPVHG